MKINKAYGNSFKLYWDVITSNYPIKINSKNNKLQINNLHDLMFFTNEHSSKFTVDGDVLYVIENGKIVAKFEDWRENGDFASIYGYGVYEKLDFRGKTVFDIGANVGDSSVYFSINGASQVIAVEPAPLNFQALEKNIRLNSLKNVSAINCGIGRHESVITVKKDFFSNGHLLFDKSGDRVKMMTLDDLTRQYHREPSVLKMDCEGYEIEIILNSTSLDLFDQILLEYHVDKISELEQMKTKLESDGFLVEVKEKGLAPDGKMVGMIFAVGINN